MDLAQNITLQHFIHHHPLEATICPSTPKTITCHGCNLAIPSGKEFYYCKSCSFSLHRVCSSMPRKTRHPSHPKHYLTLLVSPPFTNCTSKCMACGKNISGFYYNCVECNVNYHILCSALPLSVAISSHPHTLKIEFLPPYEFSCDLCHEPSDVGWLYRCRFCEFDAHIFCAVSNQRTKHVELANTLTRQIIYSSASIMETNRLIDYGIAYNELMQLVAQGARDHQHNKNGQEIGLAGWDERLRSPRMKSNENENVLSFTSEELSATPSYQCSDMCFSIDLLKSSSNQCHKSQTNKEDHEIEEKVLGEFQQEQQQLVFNPLYKAPENWLNKAYLLGGTNPYDGRKLGQNQEKNYNTKSYAGSSPSTNDQSIESNSACCECFHWWKQIRWRNRSRYQTCSKSFKNGGQ